MNLKALITTLVLGSSSMASADSLSFSGSVTVSLGGSTTARPAHAPARPYQPVATRPVVVVADDCHDAPAPSPVVYMPPSRALPAAQPVWRGPYFNITNTIVGPTASSYNGWLATSRIKAPYTMLSRFGDGRRHAAPSTTWFDLSEPTRIDSGREVFRLGADNGLFKALRLQALGNGRSEIRQVAIELIDGRGNKQTQVVKLNTAIGRNNPSVTLDLAGGYRAIGRIIVYGATDRGAAYKLMAM